MAYLVFTKNYPGTTFTEDWREAQKRLRERLQATDSNVLPMVRRGEELQFAEWTGFFLENSSKLPMREPKTHEANLRAITHLNGVFGSRKLAEITADDIEAYLRLCRLSRNGRAGAPR